MMKTEIRMRNFLIKLDDYICDCEYYDDDLERVVCTITDENEVYNDLMKIDEYHLLGTDKVKKLIHIFLTDYALRMEILHAYKAI